MDRAKWYLPIEKKAEIIGNDISLPVIEKWKKADKPWITLYDLDFRVLFTMLGDWVDTDTLIYADPPYPVAWRSAKRKVYSHEKTIKDHNDLLEIATDSYAACAAWLIKGSDRQLG